MLCGAGLGQPLHAAQLALVIDDVGYNRALGLRAIDLPAPITVAVLPFAPHAEDLAARATRRKHDVIVHQPMQARPSAHARHERDTLTEDMTADEFDAAVARALDAIPQTVGLSNHSGSLLTSRKAPMNRLMRQLQQRNMYFLDSRTSADTVALQMARARGLPAIPRDVFLDHNRDPSSVAREFERALTLARRQGYAVIIAHPYQVSLGLLENKLIDLPPDITLVRAADLASRARLSHPATLVRPPDPASPHISLAR